MEIHASSLAIQTIQIQIKSSCLFPLVMNIHEQVNSFRSQQFMVSTKKNITSYSSLWDSFYDSIMIQVLFYGIPKKGLLLLENVDRKLLIHWFVLVIPLEFMRIYFSHRIHSYVSYNIKFTNNMFIRSVLYLVKQILLRFAVQLILKCCKAYFSTWNNP